MATTRDLNSKIASLKNMQKVMSAMNMIASTKLRKLLSRQESLEKFRLAVEDIGDSIGLSLKSSQSPLVNITQEVKNIHIIAFTADKGLCGSHNTSVLKVLAKTIEKEKKKNVVSDITCIGVRASRFCRRRGYNIYHAIDSNEKHISDIALREIATACVKRILNGEVDKVLMIYNHFRSTLVQETKQLQVFPIDPDTDDFSDQEDKRKIEAEIGTEPGLEEFILPTANLYFYYKLKTALTDSYLSEHAARMTAMENAKTNSEDLINRYGTIRNHARQAAITSELIEIVAGKEALKS